MEGHMVAGSVLRTEDRAGKKTDKNFLTPITTLTDTRCSHAPRGCTYELISFLLTIPGSRYYQQLRRVGEGDSEQGR